MKSAQEEHTVKIRKNQTYLTSAEWDHFICAYQDITPGFLKGMDKPSLDDFADEHAAFKDKNHGWYVLGAALFRLAPGVLKCL